jgi:hypothetical protein
MKIERKPAGVSLHCFVQVFCLNTVEASEIGVQHDSGATHKEYFLTDKGARDDGFLRGHLHGSTLLRFQIGTSKQHLAGYIAASVKSS